MYQNKHFRRQKPFMIKNEKFFIAQHETVLDYCSIVVVVGSAKGSAWEALERAKAEVQRDKITQEARKRNESQAVNRFNTSAVAVPKIDTLASPPKEAPKPELLLS
jgi:hypothetical protein